MGVNERLDYFLELDNYIGAEEWKQRRYFYSGGNIEYIAKHKDGDAESSDGGWYVWKYVFDGSDNLLRMEGYKVGVLDDRATLGWI